MPAAMSDADSDDGSSASNGIVADTLAHSVSYCNDIGDQAEESLASQSSQSSVIGAEAVRRWVTKLVSALDCVSLLHRISRPKTAQNCQIINKSCEKLPKIAPNS